MSGNADKAAGVANEAAGKVTIGKAVGSDKLQGEGATQEAKGDAQQLKGDTKNAIKDGVNKVADAAKQETLMMRRVGRVDSRPSLPVSWRCRGSWNFRFPSDLVSVRI